MTALRLSKLEETMALHIKAAKLPAPEREYKFSKDRKWKFDFCWPSRMIAVEVEGTTCYGKNKDGSMRLGRHQTAKGFASDCEKYNSAVALGWRVFRYTEKMIGSGDAIIQLEGIFKQERQ